MGLQTGKGCGLGSRGLQRRRERRIAKQGQGLVVRSGQRNPEALRETEKNWRGIAERGADARRKRRIAEEERGLEGGKCNIPPQRRKSFTIDAIPAKFPEYEARWPRREVVKITMGSIRRKTVRRPPRVGTHPPMPLAHKRAHQIDCVIAQRLTLWLRCCPA